MLIVIITKNCDQVLTSVVGYLILDAMIPLKFNCKRNLKAKLLQYYALFLFPVALTTGWLLIIYLMIFI